MQRWFTSRWVHLALVLTLVTLGVWAGTGRDWFTKFEVVEQVSRQVDPDDPLAAAGFYEGRAAVETVTRPEFRLGLLPASQTLDRHLLSVASVLGPVCGLSLIGAWRASRRAVR